MSSLRQANDALTGHLVRNGPYDLVYERYSLWSYGGMQFSRDSHVPGVLEVNAPLIEEQARYREMNAPDFAKQVARQTFQNAEVIGAVSSQVANYVESFPDTGECVHVIPNGINPSRFPSQNAARDLQHFTVGFVGSLKPWHGLSTLVESFVNLHRTCPESRLLVVGDGPERENLLAQLASAGRSVLAASTLTGAVPSGEVPRYLNCMDVGVAPYPAMPGFYFSPMKIFEYMAAGLPVVASRIGDLPYVMRDGFDGTFYAPDDAAELTDLLIRLRRDSTLRCRLGQNARVTVLRNHTWEKNAERVLSLAGVTGASLQNC
jgi:glycosyltransferase involved in cell wall biosynthesis